LVPAGSWQRTLSESLLSSLTGLGGCAMSLRLRATKSGRSLLVPTTLGLRTEGSGSGSWPTAEAADGSRGSLGHMRGNPTLLGAAAMWPTVHGMDNEGNPRRNGPTGNELGRAVTQQEWATPNTMGGGQTSRGGKRKGELLLGGQVREWPTATATAYGNNRGGSAGRVGPVRPSLEGAARLWPTARAEDSESAGAHVARGTAETLTAAARLWPTATGGDSKASGTRSGTQAWQTPQARDGEPRGAQPMAIRREQGHGSTLPDQLAGLPDQGSSRWSGKRRGLRDGLNPDWVTQLLGLPDGWLCPPSALSDEWLFRATAGPRSRRSGTASSRSARKQSAGRSSQRKVAE